MNAPSPGDHSVSWLTPLPEYLALIDPVDLPLRMRCFLADLTLPYGRVVYDYNRQAFMP